MSVTTDGIKASSFTDRATAETVISEVPDSNKVMIQNYLSGTQKGYLTLNYQSSSVNGISVTSGSTGAVQSTNAQVVIARDSSMPDGYKIITGYPT